MSDEFDLDDYSIRMLNEQYDRLVEEIGEDKLSNNSVLFYFISPFTESQRHIALSATSTKYIDPVTVNNLCSRGLMRETDTPGMYTLTAKGVFFVEEKRSKSAVDVLINQIDSKYFSVFGIKTLQPRRKIILLSMIAIRCFDKESSINMRDDARIKDAWWKIFNDMSDFLVNNGVIQEKNSLKNYKSSSKIEHPASNLIRHTDGLLKDTRGIYNNQEKKNTYYLDICRDGEISVDRLRYLIQRIFEDRLTDANVKSISSNIIEYPRLHGLDVLSSLKRDYHSTKYDEMIYEAFYSAVGNEGMGVDS